MPDFLRARKVINRQIRKSGERCVLRRAGEADRVCWAMEAQLTTHEQRSLKNPTSRVFTISAVGEDGKLLTEGPVYGKDSLVTFLQPDGLIESTIFRQVAPTAPFSPGGVIIYWDIEVTG